MTEEGSKLPVVHRGTPGRPPYSDKVRAAILANLKIGCTRTAAFGSAGINETTFYAWMHDIPGFAESVAEAEAAAERAYTGRLTRRAAQGDTVAIKFWLERRRPANWREKVTIEEGKLTPEEQLDEALNSDDLDRRLQALADDAQRRRASRASRDAEASEGSAGSGGEPS